MDKVEEARETARTAVRVYALVVRKGDALQAARENYEVAMDAYALAAHVGACEK